MNAKDSNKIILEQLKKCEMLLCSKAKEYSLDTDRLASFKTGAQLQGITPKQCLMGYTTKHIVSISDMIRTNKKFTLDRWEEKITDTINYLLLLKALVTEELLMEDNNAEYSN